MTTEFKIPNDLIGPKELAPIVGLSEATIRSDATRRPDRLPPRFLIPGSNRLKWSRRVALAWVESHNL